MRERERDKDTDDAERSESASARCIPFYMQYFFTVQSVGSNALVAQVWALMADVVGGQSSQVNKKPLFTQSPWWMDSFIDVDD